MDDQSTPQHINWLDAPAVEPAPLSRLPDNANNALARLAGTIAEANPAALERTNATLAQRPAGGDLQTIAAQIGDAAMLAFLARFAGGEQGRNEKLLRLFPPRGSTNTPHQPSLDDLARRQLLIRMLADVRVMALYYACESLNAQPKGEPA